ncbi:hypothetical protein BDR04DRAFT_718610 [Suillus decipiens]|nr:hypothetical protein BDR04DRAFT_718610 [Suillus decipiens]
MAQSLSSLQINTCAVLLLSRRQESPTNFSLHASLTHIWSHLGMRDITCIFYAPRGEEGGTKSSCGQYGTRSYHLLQCVKSRSRIWLCTTAAFTSILLHAADPFRTKVDGFSGDDAMGTGALDAL